MFKDQRVFMTKVKRVQGKPYVVKIDLNWAGDVIGKSPPERAEAYRLGIYEPVRCQANALMEVETEAGIIYTQHFYTEESTPVDNDSVDRIRVEEIERKTLDMLQDIIEAFHFIWPGTPDYQPPTL